MIPATPVGEIVAHGDAEIGFQQISELNPVKGIDIVVGGDIGHMSAFMAQAGRLVVRGDAGEALGDSIYETHIYVRGAVASLGADCIAKDMRPEHHQELETLLKAAGFEDDDTAAYTRYGSARALYHFHVDNASAY